MSNKTFEESMSSLEKTVRQLESGELSLDQSIAAFENGIKLVHECEDKLKEAKGKIEKLVCDSRGQIKTEAFETKE